MLLAINKKELERIEIKVVPTTFKKKYEDRIDWFISGFYLHLARKLPLL